MHCYDLPYLPDSAELFLRIADLPDSIWLDSCHHGDSQGRYDIMSASPDVRFKTLAGITQITTLDETTTHTESPFELIKPYLEDLPKELPNTMPFCGGLMGYFGYELGHKQPQHTLISRHQSDETPSLYAGIYSWSLIQDHQSKRCWLYCLDSVNEVSRNRLLEIVKKPSPARFQYETFQASAFSPNMSKARYLEQLQRIDDYIHAGDCYQVNFAQRFKADFSGSTLAAYLHLRQQLPSPYSAYLNMDDGAILSHSPERFIRIQGERVDTKPIKGTIARGLSPEEDALQAKTLQDSAKDRAENLMIVDLLRNDLSRSCKLGSVRVPRLFALESYRNVHHLVSTVCGTKKTDESPLDVFLNSFPGGSVTGAPKKRAMEIIDELEPDSRTVYCGSLGYLSANGNMDTSITIRTLLADGKNHIYCWGGGAITADSDPESEYQESLTKVTVLMRGLQKEDGA